MKAQVINKQYIAEGILQVDLDIKKFNLSFQAGQYLNVELIDPSLNSNPGPKRYFSIISSPNDKETLSIATVIRDSAFKQTLTQLPIGQSVEIGPILGKFTLPATFGQSLVMIAGGIGITPFISMLRWVREEKLAYKVTLIYSGKRAKNTAFLTELMNYQKEIPHFQLIMTLTSDSEYQGEVRRIDSDFLVEYLTNLQANLYYLSGSVTFVQAMIEALTKIGVEKAKIKTDSFTGY